MWQFVCLSLLLVASTLTQTRTAVAAVPSPSLGSPNRGSQWPQSASLLSNTDPNPEDICTHCYCNQNTVFCNFAHNHTLSSTWNSGYVIPARITGIEIQLADNTHWQLRGGLFRRNRVNLFVVKGTSNGNANNVAEFTKSAFEGNLGGYPDIQILDVAKVYLRENSFSGGEIKLRVSNSNEVVLFKGAFVNMNMSCSLENIRDLTIEEQAFNPHKNLSTVALVNLFIENSHIANVESFGISMNKIVFKKCEIGTIHGNTFNVNSIKQLSIEFCRIKLIAKQAFTDRLHSDNVSITGTQIGTIDSEAIMGSGITNFTLSENIIDVIKEEAIRVFSYFVHLKKNQIKHQEKNWLYVITDGCVTIENNRFENFAPFRMEPEVQNNCTFANNFLGNLQPHSLNFTHCKMHAITIDRLCHCEDTAKWLPQITDSDLSTETYCQLPSRLQTCFNATTVHLRRYANEACGANRTTLHCHDRSTLELHDGHYLSKEEREEAQRGISYQYIIYYVVIFVFSTLIICLLCRYCVHCQSRQKEPYCVFSPEECRSLQQDAPEPLKKLLKKLTSNTQRKTQCENIIIAIYDVKNVTLSAGAKKILGDHMQKSHPPNSGVTRDDNQYQQQHQHQHQHQHQLQHQQLDHQSMVLHSASNELSTSEHIYAEPLLSNEYSSPSDPVDPTTANLYSEPINSANSNDMPPAYEAMPQYATPIRQPAPPSKHNQLAFTSQRQKRPEQTSTASYATPVWRATPTAKPIAVAATATATLPTTEGQRHVRDLRHDLESVLTFHPNQRTQALPSRFASNPRRPQAQQQQQQQMKSSFECLDGAASLAAMELMDMRGAVGLPPDSGSDHSGGSDETVKIDDVEYADA